MKRIFFLTVSALFFFNACDEITDNTGYISARDGIIGYWDSRGANVAVLLKTDFSVDSIFAKFNADKTYLIESFSKEKSTTYSGSYVQTASTVAGIWNITLNQTIPYAATSAGIFKVNQTGTNAYNMRYEVVQTQPNFGSIPPTAAEGFGSSNGGAQGTKNIQTYVKM